MIFKGVLLHLDGVPDASGDMFPENADVKLPDKEVPVSIGFSEKIADTVGTAKLVRNEKSVGYEINILREDIPKSIWGQLKPCAQGKITKRLDSIIGGFSVEGIGLCADSTDTRVKRLGEE